MDYSPVGPEHFDEDDHTEAKEVGADFVNALRRVRVSFGAIGIDHPCDTCQQDEHRIYLGWITLAEARRMTATVNAAMDELDRYRQAGRVPRLP
ncbi:MULTISPECIES: hypothetical protein [unclassified Streptomyces]|uniref:hypothetical protein n=1 Tax=unclassified Streptomyces TaxID=2593676 RepID=UPI00093F64B3|nr:hypothetical protein [Streptomyces sp. TSRI0281]OKI31687.1 hypothetical protein A6A29_23910 [Streptomyces sp. TSRI0281]